MRTASYRPPPIVCRGGHNLARRGRGGKHAAWRKKLAEAGVGVTAIIDRFYFHSICFQEPGGVLFEIATDGPGFASDEEPDHLGEKLSLPPFLESRRERIESGLKPITPVKMAART